MAQEMDMSLTKAGPIRDDGNISVITFKKKSKPKLGPVLIPDREEGEMRTCEGKYYGDSKVTVEGDVPGARAEIPLQVW